MSEPKGKKYPIRISVGPNPKMMAFDLEVMVGGFESQFAARKFGERIKEFLEDEANAKFLAVN